MKKFEYEGKIYCENDLSEEIDNYGGDLFDLYWDLKKNGEACEETYYYPRDIERSDQRHDTVEELIENEFDYLEVEE